MTPSCEPFVSRLLDGEAPAADPALVEHLGTCLHCFRLQVELRDLPRIREVLRLEAAPDPGSAFWSSFPSRSWQAAQEAQTVPQREPGVEGTRVAPERSETPPAVASAPRLGIRTWLRNPVLAGLGGAAFAAALMVILLRPERTPAPERAEVASLTAPGPHAGTQPAESLLAPPDLAELDGPALRAVLAAIADGNHEVEEFIEAVESDAALLSPMESVQGLDKEALLALGKALETPI